MLGKVCKRWALNISRVIIKFVTPDSYKTIYAIELEVVFQRMFHIHHMFSKNTVDFIMEDVKETSDGLTKSNFPS